MADNETIADITAEMRDEAARADMEQGYSLDDAAEMMRELASRIDEAHKRECGNVAKLRDAVKSALDKLLLWNYTDRDTARMALGVMNKLEAALATTSSQNTQED